MKHVKWLISIMMTAAMLVGLLVFPAEAWGKTNTYTISPVNNIKAKPESDWTICIYMCGSDLESNGGAATNNLIQMIETDIPEDNTVLVMTGGALKWDPIGQAGQTVAGGRIPKGSYVTPDSGHNQIFEVDDDGMHLLHTYPEYLPMNDMNTAAAFLSYAMSYAPSDKLMISFWDHGGGPVRYSLHDEHTNAGASPSEIAALVKAANEAWGKKIDLVGFDTCVTANLDMAWLLSPYAEYMVASEEIEPGKGWYYHWLSRATGTPVELGKTIVDSYAQNSNPDNTWADVSGMTLALIDLNRVPALADAFSAMAKELNAKLDDPETYAPIARAAEFVLSMGHGTSGLLDLYDFANLLQDNLETADDVITALGTPPDDLVGDTLEDSPAVLYRGVSPDFWEAGGLAFYHPTLTTTFANKRAMIQASERYRSLGLSEDYADYVDVLINKTEELKTFQGDMSVRFNTDNGHPILTVQPADAALALKYVTLRVSYLHQEPDGTKKSYLLGDTEVEADWYTSCFEGVMPTEWFALNGELYSVKDQQNDMYDEYLIPVVIEGNDFVSEMTACRVPGASELTITSICDPAINADTMGRTYAPSGESFTFRTVFWNAGKTDFMVNKPYTITPNAVKDYCFPVETVPLTFEVDSVYETRFVAMDMKGNLYESAPVVVSNIENMDDLTIQPIPPQIFTGEPVEPKLTYLYGSHKIIEMDEMLDLAYSDNQEIGTATVTATSTDPEVPGQLSAEFEIKPLEEIFLDLDYDQWYFPSVNYMYSNGYMNGTGNKLFSPDENLTRSMTVEILYRASNQIGSADISFEDVSPDDSCFEAVQWAVGNNIMDGYNDTLFGADDPITREQLMIILYRYAQTQADFTPAEDVPLTFGDLDQLSNYATEAAAWMTQNSIITGYNDNTLRPQNNVTRIEAAAIFTRMLEGKKNLKTQYGKNF